MYILLSCPLLYIYIHIIFMCSFFYLDTYIKYKLPFIIYIFDDLLHVSDAHILS